MRNTFVVARQCVCGAYNVIGQHTLTLGKGLATLIVVVVNQLVKRGLQRVVVWVGKK